MTLFSLANELYVIDIGYLSIAEKITIIPFNISCTTVINWLTSYIILALL